MGFSDPGQLSDHRYPLSSFPRVPPRCGLNATEKDLAESKQTRAQLATLLDQAIAAITTCHAVYAKENIRPFIRRMLNLGFFSKVYIDEDGSVSDGEIQEPFAHLLAHLKTVFYDRRKNRLRHVRYSEQLCEARRTGTDSYPDRTLAAMVAGATAEHEAVLLSFDRRKQNRPTLAGGPGLNDEHLAEAEGFEPFPGLQLVVPHRS